MAREMDARTAEAVANAGRKQAIEQAKRAAQTRDNMRAMRDAKRSI